MPRSKKRYSKAKDVRTGRRRKVHRILTEHLPGRPLLPTEVVHHRDGDSTNNSLGNLIVLASQALHAHLEHLLRCHRRGMPLLFPEFLTDLTRDRQGTLFEHIYCPPTGLVPGLNTTSGDACGRLPITIADPGPHRQLRHPAKYRA